MSRIRWGRIVLVGLGCLVLGLGMGHCKGRTASVAHVKAPRVMKLKSMRGMGMKVRRMK